jgi:hypothetical protein
MKIDAFLAPGACDIATGGSLLVTPTFELLFFTATQWWVLVLGLEINELQSCEAAKI